MVNVFKQESLDRQTNKQTDKQTDATKRIISPALRSIIMCANMVDSLSAGDVWQTFVIIASWSTKNRDLTWKFMYDRWYLDRLHHYRYMQILWKLQNSCLSCTGLHNFHILPHMCLIAHISTHQLIKESVREIIAMFGPKRKFIHLQKMYPLSGTYPYVWHYILIKISFLF